MSATHVRNLCRAKHEGHGNRYIRPMTTNSRRNLIGYARVSTRDQSADLQVDGLSAAGCRRVFVDQSSGAKADRPELSKALDYLRDGDTLVVWRLDRLGRSLRHLVDVITELEQSGIGFKSLQESIDTTTPGGRLTFHIFASLAEFERDLISERTRAGLDAARARGRLGGRRTVMTPLKLAAAREMLSATDETGRSRHTVSSVAETLGVSRASIYRALERSRGDLNLASGTSQQSDALRNE